MTGNPSTREPLDSRKLRYQGRSITRLDHEQLTGLVRACLARRVGTRPRRDAARTAISYLIDTGTIAAWAKNCSSPTMLGALVDRDEVRQIIVAALLERLATMPDPGPVRSWAGWLYMKSRQAVRDRLQTSGYTVASGMATVLRRYRIVQSTTDLLNGELGRAPTRDEVIEAANAGRADRARRDGTLVTDADFRDVQVGLSINSMDDVDDGTGMRLENLTGRLPAAPDPAIEVEAADHTEQVARRILDLVEDEHAATADTLMLGRVWLDEVVDGGAPPRPLDLAEILEWESGRTRAAHTAWLSALKLLAADGELDWLRAVA